MAKKPSEEQEKPTFEERLGRLDEIVTRLESADVGLDESLRLYAEGAVLIKDCRRTLAEAEKRIAKLTEDAAGQLVTEPFQPEDAGQGRPEERRK